MGWNESSYLPECDTEVNQAVRTEKQGIKNWHKKCSDFFLFWMENQAILHTSKDGNWEQVICAWSQEVVGFLRWVRKPWCLPPQSRWWGDAQRGGETPPRRGMLFSKKTLSCYSLRSDPCFCWALRSRTGHSSRGDQDIIQWKMQLQPGTSLLYTRCVWKESPFPWAEGDLGLLQGCFSGFSGGKALHNTPLRTRTVHDAESTICSCLIAVYKSVNFAYGMSKDSGVM